MRIKETLESILIELKQIREEVNLIKNSLYFNSDVNNDKLFEDNFRYIPINPYINDASNDFEGEEHYITITATSPNSIASSEQDNSNE